MMPGSTRRTFLKSSAALAAGTAVLPNSVVFAAAPVTATTPLKLFEYRDIQLLDGPMLVQFQQNQSLFMSLNEDSLLKPFRQLAGQPAPGEDVGGWYTP